ncbi:hypothetical protein [Streptomyces sp. NPDC008125]|uniref:hypothetical protein n=1 Tax=Streptomyces sp. NPDC008125 TaxID=3364811 RepID=UPI0036E0D062
MSEKEEFICRVCGYDFEDIPTWIGIFSQGVICNCCNMEAGLEDADLKRVRMYRGWWVAEGASWARPADKPADWDLLTQMSNVPKKWR